jgi:hypothetical protein
MKGHLSRIIEKRRDWSIPYLKKVPGVSVQNRTCVEASRNVDDALRMVKFRQFPNHPCSRKS